MRDQSGSLEVLRWHQRTFGAGCLLAALLLSSVPSYAQSYEASLLFGARFCGSVNVQPPPSQPAAPNFNAQVANSATFGAVGGFRFSGFDGEGYELFEFRWMRQSTDLRLKPDNTAPAPTPSAQVQSSFLPHVTLDHYLMDVSHEFEVAHQSKVAPFVSASVGAARLGTPESSAVRFAFGLGAGVKVFPRNRWGFRVKFEYLPVVMQAELQKLVCGPPGCAVALSGGLMNQFEVSIGPSFRF